MPFEIKISNRLPKPIYYNPAASYRKDYRKEIMDSV
jgi:hypothetical protein